MSIPKTGRRRIVVDGGEFWWNPSRWEATEFVVVYGSCIHSSIIHVNPLSIMLPRHVAACIKFARELGWRPEVEKDLWLGFETCNEDFEFFQIPPQAHAIQ